MLLKSLIRFDSLINILLPRACLLCRTYTREPHHLCRACALELPILSHSCQKCAQFLHSSAQRQLICGECLINPPPYDVAYALFRYQPPLPKLIAGLKFEEQFSYAALFHHLMAEAVRHNWYAQQPLPDMILPMPLHPTRLRERGYNQAMEVARPLSRSLKLRMDQGVIRHKATLPQHALPAAKRRQNIAQAFSATKDYTGKHVAIVDDVMTTGHTVAAIASVLKMHGARRVDIWCCARA